ncbi:MAG TPA: type VII secretion-associated protein [Pseudonocardiaceae bacterium]|jgi:type VII secretion-associated protein (TIGR03931 family)|nr:type VII secretion-associated protein [Pseudonocardiaceae bacterium]
MTLHVAVDFGTSSTCVAISVDGREPQVVVVDGQPIVPSAVFAAVDGTVFVGQEAERQAAIDPARYEPNPKRRIDDGELLLGNTVISVLDVVRAVLSRAVTEARGVAGNAPVDLLVLTHPADWGAIRTRVLRQAGAGLAAEVTLVPEPVAAAVFHAAGHALPDRSALAVLDLGGGTVDVSVVRRMAPQERERGHTVAGFAVLATHGDPNFGGADIDQLLLEHVGSLVPEVDRQDWLALTEGREMADRRRGRVLRQDVRGAKETLSRHTYTDVPMPPPFADAHVTRDDLERLVAGPLRRAVAMTVETVAQAGLAPDELAGVFLVGGSSRIPLVARLVYQRLGIIPTTLDQPETVVARGALRAVTPDPLRTGGLPTQQAGPGRADANAQTVIIQSPFTPPRPYAPRPAQSAAPPVSTAATTPPRRRPGRRRVLLGAVALVIVAAAAVGVLTATRGGPAPEPTALVAPPGQHLIAQYDYRFVTPKGWAESASNSTSLEVRITPENAPASEDAIYVREYRLSYDSTKDRARAVQQLHPQVVQAGYLNFTSSLTFANRTVAYYQQPGNDATADWYVLFEGKVQVSIGCQYPTVDLARVRTACEQVVSGMVIGH